MMETKDFLLNWALADVGPFAGAAQSYIDKVLSYSPIAYWPLNEPSGGTAVDASGNGYDGAYTGVTLGQTGIGDGETCPLFDGANDYCDIYSAGLDAAFDKDEGSMSCWVKVFNAGVWTDGLERYAFAVRNNWTNKAQFFKDVVNNRVYWHRGTTGDISSVLNPAMGGYTDWFHVGMTWSVLANEMKAFLNGPQEGSTQTISSWTDALAADECNIGSKDQVPSSPWLGWVAHYAIWDTIVTPAQMLALASV